LSVELQVDLVGSDFRQQMEHVDASIKACVQERLEEIAESIRETAQRLAPVRTGYLRSTVFTEALTEWTVKVGARAPYASYMEYGTRYITGHHFLSNAIEQHRIQFADMISQAVSEGIAEASH
jgi:HK97 gp10 family phage protein